MKHLFSLLLTLGAATLWGCSNDATHTATDGHATGAHDHGDGHDHATGAQTSAAKAPETPAGAGAFVTAPTPAPAAGDHAPTPAPAAHDDHAAGDDHEGHDHAAAPATPAAAPAGGYICPMRKAHPKVFDQPGTCPDCGMTLEPVNK